MTPPCPKCGNAEMSTFNGGWFYDELKEALRFLGLRWGDMHLVQVVVDGNEIKFIGNGRSVTVQVCPTP